MSVGKQTVFNDVLRDCTSTFGPVNKVMVEPSKRTISNPVREIFIHLFVIFYTAILNLS